MKKLFVLFTIIASAFLFGCCCALPDTPPSGGGQGSVPGGGGPITDYASCMAACTTFPDTAQQVHCEQCCQECQTYVPSGMTEEDCYGCCIYAC